MARPADEEYTHLAQQLGVNQDQIRRIGKYEARRLLSMDESSRRLVISIPSHYKDHRPVVRPGKRVY